MKIRRLSEEEIKGRREYDSLLKSIGEGWLYKRKRAKQIADTYDIRWGLREAISEGVKKHYNDLLHMIKKGHYVYFDKYEKNCIKEAKLLVRCCGMDGNKLEKILKKVKQ